MAANTRRWNARNLRYRKAYSESLGEHLRPCGKSRQTSTTLVRAILGSGFDLVLVASLGVTANRFKPTLLSCRTSLWGGKNFHIYGSAEQPTTRARELATFDPATDFRHRYTRLVVVWRCRKGVIAPLLPAPKRKLAARLAIAGASEASIFGHALRPIIQLPCPCLRGGEPVCQSNVSKVEN